MASIEKFEDILSWKEARILNKLIGKLIDDKRNKEEFDLISEQAMKISSLLHRFVSYLETSSLKGKKYKYR